MSPAQTRTIQGVVLLIAVLHLLQLLDFGFGRDQAIYALAARAIHQGGAPYLSVWDFKPPGIFFIYALIQMFGSGVAAVRAWEAAAVASFVPAFMILSRRFSGDSRAGIIAGTLAIVCYVQLEFWHTAQPESFGGVVLAWLLVVATGERVRPPALVAAGLLAAAAVLLKPTIGIAAAPAILLMLRRVTRSDRWRQAIWLGAGFAVPIAGTVAFFASRRALPDLIDSQIAFAPAYVAFTWSSHGGGFLAMAAATWMALRSWLFGFSLPNLVGLVMFIALAPSPQRRQAALWMGSTLAALFAGVIVQAKLFAYHFGALLPLTALPAGWGWWLALTHTRRASARLATLAAMVMLTAINPKPPDMASFVTRSAARLRAWMSPETRLAARDSLYSVADFSAPGNRVAAEWVRANVKGDQSIFVWGFAPNIYLLTDRRPASRYVYNLAQRSPWSADSSRTALMAELDRMRPAAILVEHGDRFGFLTGSPDDSRAVLGEFADLAAMLERDYELNSRLGKFDAYRRVSR